MSPGALDAPETIPAWDLPAEGAQLWGWSPSLQKKKAA